MIDANRRRYLRRGFFLEVATVAWNVLEGVIAAVAGLLAGSVALIGFGIDSFIETSSGIVVGWRLRKELVGKSEEKVEEIEKKTTQIAGALLLLLALYILIDSSRRLLGFGAQPRESILGIIITAVSLVVMPVLAWAKLSTARVLNTKSLHTDAYETITCAWLSLTTLAGLLINATLGWWWADPVAALLLIPLIIREGIEGIKRE